jgi:DNA-binding CsgD family transcriptional regulator
MELVIVHSLIEPLTEREQDVLALLLLGKSNNQIADTLVLSLNTVKWYNRQIYDKLGVENREGLVERARELGLGESEVPKLPLQLSSFIGRQQELAEVDRLLAASRLVTLTGSGGSGKTRLALKSAARVSATFADGVRFVELAPLSDPALIPQAVALALDVPEVENRPILTLLLHYLRAKRLLLVRDNCEHLVKAAAQLADNQLSH